MSHLVSTLLLTLCCVAGLLLIPLGLPGLWLMVLGVLGYGWLTAFRSVGIGVMALVVGLALLGEVIEWWLGFRFAERYGGSRRAGWGALVGGLVGAAIGVPVPIVGSVIGAFVGSFAGDRKSTRLNSSHGYISYAVFCLKKKKNSHQQASPPDHRPMR